MISPSEITIFLVKSPIFHMFPMVSHGFPKGFLPFSNGQHTSLERRPRPGRRPTSGRVPRRR